MASLTSRSVEAVVGLDPSLTGFALCALTENLEIHCIQRWGSKPADGLCERFARYRSLIGNVISSMECYWPRRVVLEGYSYGSTGQAVLTMAEFGGCLRRSLISWVGTLADPPIESAPGQMKKFATGRGNAKKPEVAVSIFKLYGVEFKTDDETDAYCAARIAACLAGWDTPRNQHQREVITQIEGNL